MHSSGKTLVLRAGDYQATLVTVGAGLAELTYAGQHLVLPHPLKPCRWRTWGKS